MTGVIFLRIEDQICCAAAWVRGGPEAPGLRGTVRFRQGRNSVLVVAELRGLPESDTGFFAMHIHEGPSCRGSGFPETGKHYAPDHGDHPRHAGDLPPLLRCGGGAYLAVRTDRFRVRDIIGRTLVIHSGPDDLSTQPGGNAGEKLACGVIALVR